MDLQPDESDKLHSLRRALEEEFEAHNENRERRSALQDLVDLKADMLNTIRHILKFSQSDALRGKVAMWGYDRLLEEHKTTADPLSELLNNAPLPPTTSPVSSNTTNTTIDTEDDGA